jgi:hypothetical protein
VPHRGFTRKEERVSEENIKFFAAKFLQLAYIWSCFHLVYVDTYKEGPSIADMLLYIIKFYARPVEWIIKQLGFG